jgi:MFS family permease
MLSEGLFEVMVIPYVQDVLQGGSQELGLLFTTQAVGGLIGGVLIGRLGKRVNVANLIGPGVFVLGLMTVLTFTVPIFALDLLFFFLVGPAVVGMQTGIQTLLQIHVEDRYRGRVFGTFGTVVSLAVLTGQLVASLVGGVTGAVPLMTAGGIVAMATGLFASIMLARMLGGQESVALAEPEVEVSR